MSDPPYDFDEIRETFDFLDDWNEKYRYLIELGKELPALTEEEHSKANKVDGCMSQVWMVADRSDETPPRMILRADSDAFIVKGLIAVVLSLFSHRTAEEVASTDTEEAFGALGLAGHLSMGRRNGLESMVKRVKRLATEM